MNLYDITNIVFYIIISVPGIKSPPDPPVGLLSLEEVIKNSKNSRDNVQKSMQEKIVFNTLGLLMCFDCFTTGVKGFP